MCCVVYKYERNTSEANSSTHIAYYKYKHSPVALSLDINILHLGGQFYFMTGNRAPERHLSQAT